MSDSKQKYDPFAYGLYMFAGGLAAGGLVVAVAFMYSRAPATISPAMDETRAAVAVLSDQKKVLDPQFREYLKVRIYVNALRWIPEGRLEGVRIDFGPVDERVLGEAFIELMTPKGGVMPAEIYASAMKKHGKAP